MGSSSNENFEGNMNNNNAIPISQQQGNHEPEQVNPGEKRKETDGPSGASSQPNKAKRILPSRSDVWTHYTRMKENRDRCVCHYCNNDFSCLASSGTTNLANHLKACKEYKSWLDGQANKQPILSEEGKLKLAKVPEPIFREASNEMLVLGQLPIAFIESVAWKHFCTKLNLYKPHSRRTASRDIVEMYVKRKEALKSWFSTNKQRVSLTTDIWSAETTGASYMVITAHYIDESWRLKKLIIGFKYITYHKGKTISDVLIDCLADWRIKNVFCITVDNATANTNALSHFQRHFRLLLPDSLVLDGEFMHMRCSAHIINLVVRDGLAEVSPSVTAICNAVSYVRSSINRLKAFELKVDSGKITRGSLPLDVKTRWNSTYLMLNRALKFRVAFNKMEAEDKLYNEFFLEADNGVARVGPPNSLDWNVVERLCKFLIVFYNSTLVVSASTSLNSFKCYGKIVDIATNLVKLSQSIDSELSSKATEMLKKFDKYWDGLKSINKMLIVATVFDPRKKMQFARMCFDDLYGKDSLEALTMAESLMTLLRSLFIEYNANYGKEPSGESSSSQSTTQSSQSSQEQPMEKMDLDDEYGYQRIDQRYKELLNEIGVKDSKDELEAYLKETVENPDVMLGIEYDVLSWWKVNSSKYPVLAEIAKDVFAMQVSSVASESAFSTSGRILDPYRSCLTHYMIEVLMCMDQWMKQDIRYESKAVTNAQMLSEIESLDNLEREFENLRFGEES